MAELTDNDIRESVRERYAEAARAAAGSKGCGCGPALTTDGKGEQVFGEAMYGRDDVEGVPQAAVQASLGCGVPTAVADLDEGETVLDLGAGAGADVLISAQRVGSTGRAIGLDMTDEMLDLARENARKAGVENVEFVKGYIEDLPLPDASVDVVISNCVINLSGDKPQVLARGRAGPALRWALRGLRRDRRPRHGRRDASRHGAVDRLHRRCTHARGVRAGIECGRPGRRRDPRDAPRPRARRLGDHPRAQALEAAASQDTRYAAKPTVVRTRSSAVITIAS